MRLRVMFRRNSRFSNPDLDLQEGGRVKWIMNLTPFRPLAACLLALAAARTAEPSPAQDADNLVVDPGFEAFSTNAASPWTVRPPHFFPSSERPHSGARCLSDTRSDPESYVLAGVPVKLVPGCRYIVEAWVRTEDVKGEDEGGATVCVEWSDANGRFIGGCYPHGLRGTHREWQHIEGLTGTIPTNAARFHVSCYMRRGVTGTAWWDDVSVREYRPPVIEALTTDRYREQATGGTVIVHIGLALAENHLDPSRTSIGLQVLAPDGRTATTGTVRTIESTHAEFTFDSSPLPPGTYELQAVIRSADGHEAGRATLPFRRLAETPARKAWIDEHRRLILDGQPFFPLGTYWGGVDAAHMAIYARSPFNCIMPYADIGRAGLDLAWSNGVRVIYSVKDFYANHAGLKDEAEARRRIERTVGEFRDHPALMAWYINDELPLTMKEDLTAHRRWMEELDPGRPTWVVLYQVDQIREYLPTFDVVGTDPYPIPQHPVSRAREWTRKTVEAGFGRRAVWMVPQIFNWASYRDSDDERRKARAPTLAEMRCMAWSCIAEGANGLVFYSWSDLWRMDKTLAEGGRALVREPFEERWSDVSAVAAGIRDFMPVLLSTEPPPLPRAEVDAALAWRMFAHAGSAYLLCVNTDDRNVGTGRFSLPTPFASAARVLGDADGEGRGTSWTLNLPPFGVHITRFTPGNPESKP